MVIKKTLISITTLCFLALLGCTDPASTSTADTSNAPKIPGGNLDGSVTVSPIVDIQAVADTAVPGQVVLTWKTPATYLPLTQAYYTEIFQAQCTPSDSNCTEPDPKTQAGLSSVIYVGTANSLTVSNLGTGIPYTFWAFIYFKGNWSSAVAVTITPPATTKTIDNILSQSNADTFWKNYSYSLGLYHIPAGQSSGTQDQSLFLWNASSLTEYPQSPLLSPSSLSAGINSGGNIALSGDGSTLYYADTQNNRVLIAIKQAQYTCSSLPADQQRTCILGYAGSRDNFSIVNVLGQADPNGKITTTCQEKQSVCSQLETQLTCSQSKINLCKWSDQIQKCVVDGQKCMTKPTGVVVDGDNLVISDSGNNRVMAYIKNRPAKNACVSFFSGVSLSTTDTNCAASLIIGKKGYDDISNSYNLTEDGQRILKSPGALAVYNGDLYIADTGNHRIVRAGSYASSGSFNCTSPSQQGDITPIFESNATDAKVTGLDYSNVGWNSLCNFNFLLGQQYYKSVETFANIIYQSVVGASSAANITPAILGSSVNSRYANGLARYFANPTAIKFDSSGNMFVSSDENLIISNSNVLALANSKIDGSIEKDNLMAWYNLRLASSSPSVGLKSRILKFPATEVTGSYPACGQASFTEGSCDASEVLGQKDLNSLFVLTDTDSTGSEYLGLSGTLGFITDFIVSGKTIAAVDNASNSLKIWSDWTQSATGSNYFSILNPLGSNVSSSLNSPNLQSISGIVFDSITNTFVISDVGAGQSHVIVQPQRSTTP